ncbi:2OG-Fe(II) oxygenase superfamily protein [Sodiomyces alkalinus F11]|uniref:2OG-Fe(II) oxygenase superfamily protein n=1 Tax=Sodiomyces alkalinus (strain CBS 110278 / VKM F-3762 / F11) TaxID=1314773 RepID=A0A3N2PNE2_SODAK|nr:2OG-Fe(II) oxygenase superfamily protein [Sodiomyces alkalinus F11]ROT36035.1 2OG-Fe(II) oxygenase superfamily protein [Sodiomyces alkalinus F11]
MAAAAVSKEGLFIPLIDFDVFLHGNAADRLETAKRILHGFQTAGFIYLKNHPITPATLARVFATSAEFFAQPMDAKLALGWTTPEANRGYSAPGREKVTQITDAAAVAAVRDAAPDLKESFEIGRDNVPDMPNRWPAEAASVSVSSFRPVMLDFFAQCKAFHDHVMRAIAVGMGLPESFFDPFTDDGENTLRLLHYPAVRRGVFDANPNQVRAGEHSDYGSITLLFQDDRGGLQVRSPQGGFVDATPIEGTVVVNAGDLLARWSNDTIKSTIHRVVEPPRKAGDSGEYPSRYSIAYFCNPNFDSYIDALPGTFASEAEKKYKGVKSGDYLVQRLAATY